MLYMFVYHSYGLARNNETRHTDTDTDVSRRNLWDGWKVRGIEVDGSFHTAAPRLITSY